MIEYVLFLELYKVSQTSNFSVCVIIIKKIINVLMLFVLLEFVNLVRSHELGALQPKVHFLLRSAAFTVVPTTQRPQFIATHLQNTQETYSCCPPPLLMPIHG